MCVCVILVYVVHGLANHFRNIVGFDAGLPGIGALGHDRFLLCEVQLFVVDEVQFVHAAQHVRLAQLGAFRVDHRVVGGGRLGQAGEHGRLCNRDLLEGLAKIHFCRRCKAVGALAQVNLVYIELQDFIFAQVALNLEGEQHLVEFARHSFFLGEKKIARHLHGDSARALLGASGCEIGNGRAQHTYVIYAAMFVKPFILGGKNGFLHHVWHFGYLDYGAPLLAEFAEQHTIGGVNA